ncbi:MAG: hypothetical protein FJX45_06140 [Alphaproteobacteria bacterium]|nr:hypothetical protein [Alphaproteobacteria bacterium]
MSSLISRGDRRDHAAFGRNRPNADNVIDSISLERARREKPVPTFSQRALAARLSPGARRRWRRNSRSAARRRKA